MVLPEISTIFSINIQEDLKWLLYDTFWKHVYRINSDLKDEILNKALFHTTLFQYKEIFNNEIIFSNSVFIRDSENIYRILRINNRTYYRDMMLFDVQVRLNNMFEDNPRSFLLFSYMMNYNFDLNIEEELTVTLLLMNNISEDVKNKLLYKLWNQLSIIEKENQLKKVSSDIHILYPFENIL